MTVALASLETDVYTTVRNHLTSGSYSLITGSTISNADQVVPVYNDGISAKRGFPIIEIGNPTVSSMSTDRMGNVYMAEVDVPILIVEDNAADAKTTSDAVVNKLITGKSVFKAVGLHKRSGADYLVNVGNNVISKDNKHYHYKRFNLQFDYRERVTPQ